MGTLSDNYTENVRLFGKALGVGRSVDMVSRDYRIGGRRARIWVVDGYGLDETLERMGAFWLSRPENALEGLTDMQDFADRLISFSEVDVGFDPEELVTSVLMCPGCRRGTTVWQSRPARTKIANRRPAY